MLSLSSLLNTESAAPAQHPMDDRGEHYSYSNPWKGGGGSSKGKKGSQSALSALTLLAFLFFLNMLQSALQEQMANNSPIVVMMTTTTTTTTTVEGQRQKREEPILNEKGDTALRNDKRNSKCQSCESSTVATTIDSPYDQP
ncbi:hypothetical protein GE061_012795 [Apolygus lucorum]|uniref:Uncharacterized protein n=1 Tax=Apolygus lucorum TaxID=248454 RepID=A0A6A4JUH3_APOLU|nr:hypothetical protein GE061_012795 [Apolygus lucorum]